MSFTKETRIFSLIFSLIFIVSSMSACSKGKDKNDGGDTGGGDKENYTLSMGIVLSTDSTKKGSAESTSTVAAVILDKDSKIIECKIDCAQNKMNIADGTVKTGQEYKTKDELGDDYGLKDASSIGKEWDDQVDFFEDYVEGMDRSGVDAASSDDADLSAGCTIDISDMKKALLKAMDNKDTASVFTSDAEPDLCLSVVTYDTSSKSATENSSGIAAMYTDFCALAVTDGRIDGAVIDSAEPKITFDKSGEAENITFAGTKLEQGKDYGMLAASGIDKEWYEQAAFFCDHIKGMNADEVAAIAVNSNGKAESADLSAGCTVAVDKYIKSVTKAFKQ